MWSLTCGCGPSHVGVVPHMWVWSLTCGCGPSHVGVVPHMWVHDSSHVGVVPHMWVWSSPGNFVSRLTDER